MIGATSGGPEGFGSPYSDSEVVDAACLAIIGSSSASKVVVDCSMGSGEYSRRLLEYGARVISFSGSEASARAARSGPLRGFRDNSVVLVSGPMEVGDLLDAAGVFAVDGMVARPGLVSPAIRAEWMCEMAMVFASTARRGSEVLSVVSGPLDFSDPDCRWDISTFGAPLFRGGAEPSRSFGGVDIRNFMIHENENRR